MRLNEIGPAPGSKHAKKRVGRGIGCGWGKTAGRGHKGQKERSGGYHKVGFEGGQMPLQRRLPKRGFASRRREDAAEVRLADLERVAHEVIDLKALKDAGVVAAHATRAKVILAGQIKRAVKLAGVAASKGARAAIEAAGGTVETPASAAPDAGKAAAEEKAAKKAAGSEAAADKAGKGKAVSGKPAGDKAEKGKAASGKAAGDEAAEKGEAANDKAK